jgi:hypothetical protein
VGHILCKYKFTVQKVHEVLFPPSISASKSSTVQANKIKIKLFSDEPESNDETMLPDPLSVDLDKPLRQVRSHPSLGGRSAIQPGSLGTLAMTRSLKNNFNKTGMTIAISQPGIILVKLVIAFTDQIPFIFL